MKFNVLQLCNNKCCLILILIIDNIFKIENDIFNDCFYIAISLFFFNKIVCCINLTAFLYSFKYYSINFVVSSSTWHNLIFNINAFIFSSFQCYFIMQILFLNFFYLCCALNVIIIKFYYFDSCCITIKNCESYWICYLNFATKFFNIFCYFNIRFFSIFNFKG